MGEIAFVEGGLCQRPKQNVAGSMNFDHLLDDPASLAHLTLGHQGLGTLYYSGDGLLTGVESASGGLFAAIETSTHASIMDEQAIVRRIAA